MPTYAIVIADPERANAQEFARTLADALRTNPAAPRPQLEKIVAGIVGPMKPRGTVHTIMDSDCPDGLPNCRNCGDPDFAEACKTQGHCPYCGTRHGIAPTRFLDANGYLLVEQT